MKRLLAYLFIVFSLGLTFSVKADDQQASLYKWNRSSPMPDYWVTWDFKELFGMCYNMKNKDLNNYEYCYEVDEQTFLLMKKAAKDVANNIGDNRALFYDRLIPIRKAIYQNYKSKIAKAEPSQMQQKGREVTFCQHKVSKSNLYIANTKNCWNDRYKSISEVDYVIYFLGDYQDSVSVTKATLTNNLNTLYADYSRNNLKKSRIHQIIKTTDKLKAYLPIIDKSKETQVAKKENDKSNNDQANLETEKRKIEEEKKKIEEEKRKIAEAKKKQEEEEKKRKEANAKLYVIGSGTGFFVSSSGHAVSNEHVVGICRKVATKIDGEKVFFNILKTDQVNDLGLIKGDYTSPNFLSIKSDGAEFGEDIVAFGYPLRGILSSSVKLTRGIVSSLSGLNDNYSEIQIDAAIQPGNSGGPVLNMEGQVVGVASSGLNKLAMIEEAEYIPENVNFAVAAPTLHNFLKSNGVNTKNKPLKINNTKELAKIGRPATIQLFCLNTKAKHEELKNKKKHSDVLLEKVIELN